MVISPIEFIVPIPSDIHRAPILVIDDCYDTGGIHCAILIQTGHQVVSSLIDSQVLPDSDTKN